jgi:hypothetical protein
MKQELLIGIHPATDQVYFPEPHVSIPLFDRVREITQHWKIDVNNHSYIPNRHVRVRCELDHPALVELIPIIRSSGMKIVAHLVRQKDWTRLIRPRIITTYNESDLESCDYFVVSRWGPDTLAAPAQNTRREGLLVVDTSSVGEESGEGWEQKIGSVCGYDFVVHHDIRRAWEERRLRGLEFRPVLWDFPEAAKHEYWEMVPKTFMPPCLTPIVEDDDRLSFDDGPFEPMELRYSKADMKKLPAFDVAWTSEEVPIFGSMCGTRRMIVSQRFRQVSTELGLDVDYTPVRLDAPPPEFPWFFHDDAPPGTGGVK